MNECCKTNLKFSHATCLDMIPVFRCEVCAKLYVCYETSDDGENDEVEKPFNPSNETGGGV